MKICLVTAFPPSHERLNEYGYHLALELQRNPFLSVAVLADRHNGPAEEPAGFDVIRCWQPDSVSNPVRLVRTIRDLRPDVVWYNLVFASFGVNPVAAFLGLCAPLLTRAGGYSTHVTLHHLMENVDLKDSGVRFPKLYRNFGHLATHLLLRADSVTVLLPAYRRTLLKKYHRDNVHLRAHGVFSATPEYPDFSRRGHPHRIVAFGKWGTYKRVELLLEAFPQILDAVPDCKLVIAGENHPTRPGYIESLRDRYRDSPHIEIMGYVPEEKLPDLLGSASIMVMPYSSTTGSSGVAHQACQFGLPIVCADIADFRDMAAEEGLAVDFYRIGDRSSLADTVVRLLQDPERQHEMAEQNYSAAVRLTMPQIVRQYLRSFDWQLRRRAIAPAWRLRPRRVAFSPVVSQTWNTTLLPRAQMPLAAAVSSTLELPQIAAAPDLSTCPSPACQTARIYQIDEHRRAAHRKSAPLPQREPKVA